MSSAIDENVCPPSLGLFASDFLLVGGERCGPSRAVMEPRGSGDGSLGQVAQVTTDNGHQGHALLPAFSPCMTSSLRTEGHGSWVKSAGWDAGWCGNMVVLLSGGGRRSESEVLFLETVCGTMIVYVLQGLGIKSGWKEASSTLRPCGKHLSPAGNLA